MVIDLGHFPDGMLIRMKLTKLAPDFLSFVVKPDE
jgi:hypothetical protein